ncbi:MAG: phage tail family protein [Bacteroides sp.]|nr:phage tail family protein [Bacteroides sp.]
MQTLEFKTNEEKIILSDLGQSEINGETVPIVLYDFDPNSLSVSADTVKCIGMAGQHTVSTTVNPKNLRITVTYNGTAHGRDTEEAMYALRRRLLKAFPLRETGELAYTNANGTYYLNAYPTEYPVIERITGTLCRAALYLTADYPFWHQTAEEEAAEVSAGDGIRRKIALHGDMISPMLCEVRCLEKAEGVSAGSPYFTLWTDGAGNEEIKLIKELKENQSVVCSTGLNNEVFAELRTYFGDSAYTSVNGSNYVDFVVSDKPALYPAYEWLFRAEGTSGRYSVRVLHQNIFFAV